MGKLKNGVKAVKNTYTGFKTYSQEKKKLAQQREAHWKEKQARGRTQTNRRQEQERFFKYANHGSIKSNLSTINLFLLYFENGEGTDSCSTQGEAQDRQLKNICKECGEDVRKLYDPK